MNNINLTWTEFKNMVEKKKLKIQYEELDNLYKLFASEDGITYTAQIFKNIDWLTEAPDWDWESDKTDFETNYKPNANEPIKLKSPDGKEKLLSLSRPENTTTFFTTSGDDTTNNLIGEGKRIEWDFSNTDDEVTAPTGYKRKRIEFKFIDPVWIKEGTVYFYNAKKGSYIDFFVVCPAGEYYYDNSGSLKQATEDTKITHWVVKHPMQDSVPMGDELNTEAATENAVPTNYKFWVEVTVPDSDTDSNGVVELEMYRERTVVL